MDGRKPPLFVGRKRELVALRSVLLPGGPGTVLLSGPGGSGKTSLAMMFLHQHRDAFPGGISGADWSMASIADSHHRIASTGEQGLLVIEEGEDGQWDERRNVLATYMGEFKPKRPKSRVSTLWVTREVKTWAGPHVGAKSRQITILTTHLDRPGQGNPILNLQLSEQPLHLDTAKGPTAGAGSSELASLLQPRLPIVSVDALGRPIGLHDAPPPLVADLTVVNEQLLAYLRRKPELFYSLSPRKFEEVVAHLLEQQGFVIELTPQSKDGGKDIYAVQKTSLGQFLFVVECKRHNPRNPVGVGLVRQLYSVVMAERATAGILATTSFFTKDARRFQLDQGLHYQLSLRDFLDLQSWLSS